MIINLKNIQNLSKSKNISVVIREINDNKIHTEISIDNGSQIHLIPRCDFKDDSEDLHITYKDDKILCSIKTEQRVDGLLYSV